MRLYQSLQLRQMLNLNPKLILMLRILNLPYQDLLNEIDKQVKDNVALELSKEDELLNYARYFRQSFFDSKTHSPFGKDSLDIENMVGADSNDLYTHLLEQLRLENLSDVEFSIGEILIENIDDNGFLPNYKEVKKDIMHRKKVATTKVDKVLKVIQSFEPEGVAARNTKECLLIQIEEYSFEDDNLKNILKEIIGKYLSIIKNPIKLAMELGITDEEASNLSQFIEKNLNPNPIINFNHSIYNNNVVPSFAVEQQDNKAFKIINLEQKMGPQIKISNYYLKLLESDDTDVETKRYIRKKVEAAKEFISHVNNRKQTIQKIIDIISETQQKFFRKGIHWLQPLQQNELSGQLGVYPSTISRAVAEKYILMNNKTTIPLKYLLPRNFKGNTAKKIQSIIKDLIENNPKLKDHEICELLNKENIPIKRRTVAKYRNIINIPAYNERE